MRFAPVAICALAAFSSTTFAQSSPYIATVVDADAKLWAGKSTSYPVTSTLKPGDSVWVDREDENGWLAVQDPPGKVYSLSWVSFQFVSGFVTAKPTPQNVTVEDDTTLCPGQLDSSKPLTTVRLAKVPKGTILTVVGQKVTVDGKSWFPVLPPAGDYRYIPKQMVKPDRTLNTSFTIRDNTPPTTAIPAGSTIPPTPTVPIAAVIGPPATLPGTVPSLPSGISTSPPAPPKPVVNHPLWAQAEAAEQDGRLTDAENLYFQLAQAMNQPGGDHDVANLCYTRIHAIREKLRAKPATTGTGTPRTALGLPSPPSAAGGSLPPVEASAAPLPPTSSKPIASGTLTRARVDVDGRMTYVLEISPGISILYVVAGPGVDLGRCLNKRVDLYGTSLTRKDLQKPLVVASNVEIVP